VRRELQNVLRRASRRLLLARSLERGAICAGAAGLSAAALELGWILAGRYPLMGVFAGLLPVAFGVVVLFISPVRRKLHLGDGASAAVAILCVSIGVAGVAGLVAGWRGLLPKAALPGVLLPLGAVVGAATVWIRGVCPREAAMYLDRRGRLRERLATAAELDASPAGNSAVARTVYAQALTAYRSRRADRLAMWRRTRATPAGLGLIVLLCVVLAFVPSIERRELHGEGRRLAAAIASAAPADRQAAADSLRKAARQAGGKPELAGRLVRAARAVEIRDEGRLGDILDELRREGFEIASVVPGKLLTAARAAKAGGASTSGAAPGPGGAGRSQAGSGGLVRVYSPGQGRRPAAGAANEDSGGEPDVGAVRETIPYAEAWSAARERAAARIAGGKIPPQYRRLVRDFFQAR